MRRSRLRRLKRRLVDTCEVMFVRAERVCAGYLGMQIVTRRGGDSTALQPSAAAN